MTQYLVGYYKPSFEFTRISEFMAIFDQQGTLVGLTGPSTSRQAALDARLFAAAPELLRALKNVCQMVEDQRNQPRELTFGHHAELTETVRQAKALIQTVEQEALVR
jgi:hypothetical protein